MANAYQPVQVSAKTPRLPIALTQEARVWASTKTITSHDFPHPITDVCFSPSKPYDVAVAYGNSISLVTQSVNRVRRSFTRFRDIVHSPRFKYDGRLLIAGTEDAVIKVFDAKSRTPLRTLTGHQGGVRTVQFVPDGLHAISGSDDCTVRVWDVAQARNIITISDAKDYVRSQSGSPASRHVWVTGSYDRKARLYDFRSLDVLFTLDHGSQIDDVHILPGGAYVITVGGPELRMWDLFAGGMLCNSLSCHAKAVTSAAVDTASSRLLTAGLDGYVKVHDMMSLQTKGVMQFKSQIMSVDVSADSRSFAVGMADGAFEIRKSKNVSPNAGAQTSVKEVQEVDDDLIGWGRGFSRIEEEPAGPRRGSHRYFNRGEKAKPRETDVVVGKREGKIAVHDQLLKKFSHVAALEHVIRRRDAHSVFGVVEELMNRGVLIKTMDKLEWNEVCILLALIQSRIGTPQHTRKSVLLLNVILDVHCRSLATNSKASKLVEETVELLEGELDCCNSLSGLNGIVELILAASAADKI